MGDFRSENPYLRKRYGIKERRLPNWLPIALILLISILLWTFWSGVNHSNPEVRYNLITFKPISKSAIEIRFTVNFKSADKKHSCTLVARDYQTNIVGERRYDFAAGIRNQDVTTQIPTRVAAVNAGILGCEIR